MSLMRPLMVLPALLITGVILMRPIRASAQTCTVAAAPLAFGNYRPSTTSPTDSVGTISMTCQGAASLLITLTVALSTGSGSSFAGRYMTSASGNLNYQVYTTSGRTQVWGNGTGGTGTVSTSYLLQALVPATINMSVYGRIPARQSAVPDIYNDTLLITVSY